MANQYSEKDIDLLFETSWEVCNKIGGIYAVLSTKARELQRLFPDKVVFIGPDVWTEDNPSPYFVERKMLLGHAASKCKLPHGLKIRCGRWNVPGSPIVVLVDFKSVYPMLDDVFGEMWARYGVDSLHSYGDYGEGCAFAVASAMVIKALAEHLKVFENRVVAHFDEWTTGMGLLWLEAHMPGAATLFTTHATSIGRSICGNGKPLYKYFDNYDGDQMARELNMESKHSLEKRAAMNADCFTTVSDVTARECARLLDVKVDVVTPNGFEPDFVPQSSKYTRLRTAGRRKLLKIGSILAGRELPADTMIVATSGRNEYRNKGLDIFLDSMALLGRRLQPEERQVLALVLVPAWVKEPSGQLLLDLNDNGTDRPQPDFLTHRLNNEDSDSIAVRIGQLEREGLPDNLKIVYVPCYLDGHDGIVDISYYDILPALDLTVFPSYYEPWGYTPLESIAFRVPTITSDKAGFGRWVLANFDNSLTGSGVKVVDRDDDNYIQAADMIATTAADFILGRKKDRDAARKRAGETAEKADWQYFIRFYLEAFDIAMRKRDIRQV